MMATVELPTLLLEHPDRTAAHHLLNVCKKLSEIASIDALAVSLPSLPMAARRVKDLMPYPRPRRNLLHLRNLWRRSLTNAN
jgi:hypothetical protein